MGCAAREDAEGRPRIADVSEAKEVLDDGDGMMQGQGPVHDQLRYLIQTDNEDQPGGDEFRFWAQAATRDLRTEEQRGQTVG